MDVTINVPALIACVVGLVVSIVLSVKTKVHLGVISVFFAFLIGVGMLGLSATSILNGLPLSIIFIFMVGVPFFSTLADTGMLEVLGKRIIRATKGRTLLIPLASMLAIALISCVSEMTVMYVLGPLVASLCLLSGLDPLIACMLFAFSVPMGSANPWITITGQVVIGLGNANGIADPVKMQTAVWLNMILWGLIMNVITLIIFKGFKAKKVELDLHEDLTFTRDQKVAFRLFVATIALLVGAPVLATVFRGVKFFSALSSLVSVYTVFPLMNILCVFLKLSDYNVQLKKVPWSIIVTLSGVMLLIDIAGDAGLGTILGNFIASNVPTFLVPAVFVFCSAGLSFVATFFAVLPLLFPVAMQVSASTGISMAILIACICVGAIGSGSTSPLSAMGSMILSAMPSDQQERLAPRMIKYSFVSIAIYVVLALLGVFSFIPNLMGV